MSLTAFSLNTVQDRIQTKWRSQQERHIFYQCLVIPENLCALAIRSTCIWSKRLDHTSVEGKYWKSDTTTIKYLEKDTLLSRDLFASRQHKDESNKGVAVVILFLHRLSIWKYFEANIQKNKWCVYITLHIWRTYFRLVFTYATNFPVIVLILLWHNVIIPNWK